MCALRLNNESSVLSCSGCGRYDSGSGSWALLMAQLFMCHKFVSGVGRSATIFPACLRILEAERMICCGLPLSLAVAVAYQMVMENVRMYLVLVV